MSTYPTFDVVRIEMPIDLHGWAVFAGRVETEKGPGLLFEGRPGVADHVFLWSTGDEVHAQPHYTFSTWDEFWADETGRMHATGFGGLFPFTLGDQRSLREGFLSILDRAALELAPRDPRSAVSVQTCAARLRALAETGRVTSDDAK
jgi:hypothetical protein